MAGTRKQDKVSIIGSGLIGRSFAMLFTSAGYQVFMYDVQPKQVDVALMDIRQQLKELETSGSLRGKLTAEEQFQCIKASESMEDCVKDSIHVQECVPENLQLKMKVFKELDAVAGPNTVLSSSASCLMPSAFTDDLVNKGNCLVSHPLNPPYYVPAIEVVPAPWTSKDVVERTCVLLKEIGLLPIKFTKEIPGSAINRIQYTLLNECWHLVKDDIVNIEDVDTLVTYGMAMQLVWCGPIESFHLNGKGLKNYFEQNGNTLQRVSDSYKSSPSWNQEDGKFISDEMEKIIPLDQLKERRVRRDERLMDLAHLRNRMKQKQD